MRIGFIQFRPVFGDIEGNLAAIREHVSSVEADLLVLPELATTGYAFTSVEELAELAEPFETSPSLASLRELARERSCALVVGFAERADEGLFNSAALLTPGGERRLYRKIHLFGAEKRFFLPGNLPFEVHELNGVGVGMMICFDWFFPESARVLALKGAQIICHPANLVLPWCQRAMVFACLQNRVFAVTSNRHGTEKRGEYSFTFTGGSQIVNPDGDVVACAPEDGDRVVVVDIDPGEALNKNINRYNNLFADRRPEFYRDIISGKG